MTQALMPLLALSVVTLPAIADDMDTSGFLRNGTAGFVVSHIAYALGKDAVEGRTCPKGMAAAARREAADRRPGASSSENSPASACADPEAVGPDARFHTVTTRDASAWGFNLDGLDSTANDAAANTCTHQDLAGMNGERGIDNQFYRVVGCVDGYQSSGHANSFATEMLSGSWGILITLSGVDDLQNDDDVEVGFFANADPITLSAAREPLAYATYSIHEDARFHAKTRGRIAGGVLITDPVDVRFRKVVNAMYLDRPLLDARATLTLSEQGTLEGYLGGYTPVEELYDVEFAFRTAVTASGKPGDPGLIERSSRGRSQNLHYTCNGVYHALYEFADGHPDPETGRCKSISTQYRLKAIPAFVVDVATESQNERLKR